MQSMRKGLFGIPSILGAILLSACGGAASSDEDSVAADSIDTADQVSALTSLSSDGVKLDAVGLTSNQAAQAGASGVSAKLTAGCVDVNTNQNVVTYTLVNCSGPYGLLNLSGILTATYTVQSTGGTNSLQVQLTSTALKVDKAAINVDSTAVVSGTAQSHTATVNSKTTAVTARGNTITHSGNYTAGWDGTCVSLSGNFSTRSGIINGSTQVESYSRCMNACPKQGKVTFVGNFHIVTMTFDGSATAAITLDGKSGNLKLLCQ